MNTSIGMELARAAALPHYQMRFREQILLKTFAGTPANQMIFYTIMEAV